MTTILTYNVWKSIPFLKKFIEYAGIDTSCQRWSHMSFDKSKHDCVWEMVEAVGHYTSSGIVLLE